MLKTSSPLLFPCTIALLLVTPLLGACQRAGTDAAAEAAPVRAGAAAATVDAASPPVAAPFPADQVQGLPAGFKEYGVMAFDGDRLCIVGAASSADEAAQRPYVAVRRSGDGSVLWAQALSGLEGMYQARATHCAYADGNLLVLLQSDTHSQQALSQTQLSVARLAAGGGEAVSRYVEVPGTRDRAYSAWVDAGAGNFAVRDSRLLVRGHYRFNEEPEVQHGFEVSLDKD